MKEIMARHLATPSRVADVGGAVGRYAEWLVACGHEVELVDPVPIHIEEAQRRAGQPPSFGARLGDARKIPLPDSSFDAVLLLGPLYHLGDRIECLKAIREALRICRADGWSSPLRFVASHHCTTPFFILSG